MLAVTATEYAFDMPATTPAGVTTISLANDGKEYHQAQLVQLASGVTMADLSVALQDPDPAATLKLVTLDGGPTNVAPGATVATTVDLKPGLYAFLCFFGTDDGTPHIAKGMVAGFEATGTASAGALPTGDTTVVAKDFGYDLPAEPLSPGKHTVTFTNDGPQPHEAGLVKLADGVTIDDIKAALAAPTPPDGPPPWTEVGGIAGVNPGTTATFDIDVEAGDYAYLCYIPDAATGKSHLELGMIAPVTVQ